MKNLWNDLLHEEYIHNDTFRIIAEQHPQLLKDFMEWSGIDRTTLCRLAGMGAMPSMWWEMFLTKQSSGTFKFRQSVLSVKVKGLSEEDKLDLLDALNACIIFSWKQEN